MPSTGTSNKHQNRFRMSQGRVWFCFVMTLIAVFLVWPGYTLFSAATPLIFGFPLSFAWIIFCTIAGFIALVCLFMYDQYHEESD